MARSQRGLTYWRWVFLALGGSWWAGRTAGTKYGVRSTRLVPGEADVAGNVRTSWRACAESCMGVSAQKVGRFLRWLNRRSVLRIGGCIFGAVAEGTDLLALGCFWRWAAVGGAGRTADAKYGVRGAKYEHWAKGARGMSANEWGRRRSTGRGRGAPSPA